MQSKGSYKISYSIPKTTEKIIYCFICLANVFFKKVLVCEIIIKIIITFLEFQIQVLQDLVHKYDDIPSIQKNPGWRPIKDILDRLIEYHFNHQIPLNIGKHESMRQRRVCYSRKDAKGQKSKKKT